MSIDKQGLEDRLSVVIVRKNETGYTVGYLGVYEPFSKRVNCKDKEQASFVMNNLNYQVFYGFDLNEDEKMYFETFGKSRCVENARREFEEKNKKRRG